MPASTDAQAAAVRRKALHRAIAAHDLEAMRTALHELYVDDASPLKAAGADVKRAEAYAPVVEAAVLSRVHAAGSALHREMMLNLKHTHAAFGLSADEHELVVAQIDGLDDDDADPHAVDWCAGTCLHGRVKPFRHAHLFTAAVPDADAPA